MRTLVKETIKKEGKQVSVSGWVDARRDMGKIIFIDLRDRGGIVQLVFVPSKLDKEVYKLVKKLRPEFVIRVNGEVKKRSPKTVNSKISTGKIEILVKDLEILNESKTPPFELDKDTRVISEELRLKYRYLDLRSERMLKNLELRHNVVKFFRDYFSDEGFLEVETPILTKGTPEGSREYIVPSRLHAGKFYVLPQAPQQFKQLLMVSGVEKYFQIAKCFRDEDQRGDRQPEFTQLDVEMSFMEEEEILSLMEKAVIEMVKKVAPEKKIQKKPFPRITHVESTKKYKTDKPDLRKNKKNPDELAFCWVVDFPLFEKTDTKKLTSAHHPFTSPHKDDMKILEKNPLKVRAHAFDLVLNGYELGGGSIRIHNRDLQNKIFEILGLKEREIDERFGHILDAFEFGAPPHGGIAFGLDRIIMLLANEENIREVMAFPKTGEAEDLMMGAPSELPK
ncbi:MAG: aspartate--tRNA ligase, partial [Patescibacteria group bacterium]|nr:aspartate--tRNA ligase [Patescibacteria group bacterium]